MQALALLSEDDVRDPRAFSPPPATDEIDTIRGWPGWAEEVAAQLVSFLDLQPNWASYGARTPRREAIEAAYELLMVLSEPATPAPQVVPTSRGGVQLEWHCSGIDLEVEVSSPFRFGVLYENSRTGEVREDELITDLTPLRSWIGLLSE